MRGASRRRWSILDVGLPDANGFEIFKRLRVHERRQVPVVFLTARSDEIDRVVGLELGADDYIAKPFSPRELVARVRERPAPQRQGGAPQAASRGRWRDGAAARSRSSSTKAACRSATTAARSSSRATSTAC